MKISHFDEFSDEWVNGGGIITGDGPGGGDVTSGIIVKVSKLAKSRTGCGASFSCLTTLLLANVYPL